ncbi:hypothetical protein GOODEAATRI_006694 [Goodea atripinnis]|uniref:Uncharacterized protein n=1 Tax=Goodea atripinnis TaxID=208336 RepID=A0ABV0MFN5_9TELE
MIADSETMQFGVRFNIVRDACMTALYASHIVCRGAMSRRVSFCINQLVFAEVMKLTSEIVFDIWIPPWTEGPEKLHDAAKQEQAVSAGQADVRAALRRDKCGVRVRPEICLTLSKIPQYPMDNRDAFYTSLHKNKHLEGTDTSANKILQ